MFDNIGTKLVDFFEQEGFIVHGDMKRFDKDDKHFSEVVDKFFRPLICSGKIITYNYNEHDVYEDVCGAFLVLHLHGSMELPLI